MNSRSNYEVSDYIDATSLRADALRSHIHEYGYALIRGLLPVNRLALIEEEAKQILAESGWLEQPVRKEWKANMKYATKDPFSSYRNVVDKITLLRSLRELPYHASLQPLLKDCLGTDSIFIHPRFVARVTFPAQSLYNAFLLAHQDYPEVQGSVRTFTVWFPFQNCRTSDGVLAIAPGSHRRGVLDIEIADTASGIVVKEIPNYWHSGDLNVGDVLIFDPYTVHVSNPNNSKRLKFTMDFRFQPSNEPICRNCLNLPDQNYSWDDLVESTPEQGLNSIPTNIVEFDSQFDEARNAMAITRAKGLTSPTSAVLRCLTYAARFSSDTNTRKLAQAELIRFGQPEGIPLWSN